MKLRCVLLFAFLTVTSLSQGHGDEVKTPAAPQPNEKAILQIDPGGHTANVHHVFFTPNGKQLISVGLDKVIRVWDAATGDVVRELRGQIGPGVDGALLCAAISPDGKTLAAAGVLDTPIGPRVGAIKLFDMVSGQVSRSLEKHTHLVTALAFSNRVKELTNDGQHPSSPRPTGVPSSLALAVFK